MDSGQLFATQAGSVRTSRSTQRTASAPPRDLNKPLRLLESEILQSVPYREREIEALRRSREQVVTGPLFVYRWFDMRTGCLHTYLLDAQDQSGDIRSRFESLEIPAPPSGSHLLNNIHATLYQLVSYQEIPQLLGRMSMRMAVSTMDQFGYVRDGLAMDDYDFLEQCKILDYWSVYNA